MGSMLFSKNHLWIEQEDNVAVIGITDYAQTKLGNILFLNLPEVGESLEIGKTLGDVESVKTVSDLISPVAGAVVCVNDELMDEPDVINESPYEAWFVKVNIDKQADDLMTEEQYKGFLEAL